MKFDTIESFLDEYGIEIDRKKSNRNNWMICCPFHNDSNPSCSVHKTKGIFHCFSCGEDGSVYKLISKVADVPYDVAKKMWDGEEDGIVFTISSVSEEPYTYDTMWDIIKIINDIIFNNGKKKDRIAQWIEFEESLLADWFYFKILENPFDRFIDSIFLPEFREAYNRIYGEVRTNKITFKD